MIEVFRMDELSIETRIRVIQKLAAALNYQFGANWTEEVEAELIEILKNKP